MSEKGVAASEKVNAVQNFPTPKCVRDVRSFLGLASFYRRLVPKFADCEALNDTNAEGTTVYMGSESARSFQEFEGQGLHDTRVSFPRL